MFDIRNMLIKSVDEAFVVEVVKPDVSRVVNRKTMGIVLAASGTLVYHQNGRDFLSNRENVLILPCGESYYIERGANSRCPLINFTLEGEMSKEIISIPTDKTAKLEKLFEKAERLVTFNKNEMQYLAKAILYEVFSELLDNGKNKRLSGKYSVLKPAVDYLENNISNPTLDNKILSQKSNISEAYFRRLFFEVYGVTARQYIIDVRLSRAGELLSGGELNVSAVSELCGYRSLYSFSRAFKQKYGVCPEKYKNTALL